MRWMLCVPLLVGCAGFDRHTVLVQFRDPHAVEIATTAPDGTHARLSAGGESQVPAGGGIFRVPNDNARASFTVGLNREADGTAVLQWNTGLSLTTGNEFELVRPDGNLPELPGTASATVDSRARDAMFFHGHVCVSPGGSTVRGRGLTYHLAATGASEDTLGTPTCSMGIAVDVTTPWTNVLFVRERVDSLGPLFGALWLLNGLPLLISGIVLLGDPDAAPMGAIFTTLGAIITAAALPGLFHPGHTDTVYPNDPM